MKCFILSMTLAVSMFMTETSRADASLTLVGGNTISGNQMMPNNFGVAGTIQGLSAGTYSFYLIRTPHNFTTQNLQLGVGGNYWSNFGSPHIAVIGNTATSFSISGIIPYGVECGEYETVKLNIINTLGQLVVSSTIKILNPTHQAPLTNFKINGNGAASPTAIFFYNNSVPNFITLSYTGTGTVTRYRLYLLKASANGAPIPYGPGSDSSWHNGPVPATINLRTVTGGSFVANQLSTDPGYYSVKLETEGATCDYVGAAPKIALIRTINAADPNYSKDK